MIDTNNGFECHKVDKRFFVFDPYLSIRNIQENKLNIKTYKKKMTKKKLYCKKCENLKKR